MKIVLAKAREAMPFVLPCLLAGAIPVLLKLAFGSDTGSVFQVWIMLFVWLGICLLLPLPQEWLDQKLRDAPTGVNPAAIVIADVISLLLIGAFIYFRYARKFGSNRRAIGLAAAWSVVVFEIAGAIPFSFMTAVVSGLAEKIY